MSSYYFNTHQQHPTPAAPTAASHSHHGGRNRRGPSRLSVQKQQTPNPNQHFRNVRSMKDLNESLPYPVNNYRMEFESIRSFDLEDDFNFIPNLLTESDRVSIHSSSSERSSLASNSPQSSPTQQPTSVASSFSLNSTSPAFVPPTYQHQQSSLKLHQPAATRARNAIPIINPATGITMSSPPPSVSPARMQQNMGRRW
ncbi:hypothetical protein B0H66DRAFT_325487 [Apodospora peruviana]|uniref:Uncharacterized protein n=1 Tax=Apodospora peruviana TaxID=516989 RepID=A0AAE0HXT1_9PEZI|nr:hypothetical protein B0H66DRAFT_325487 [Apodospora peruviana]